MAITVYSENYSENKESISKKSQMPTMVLVYKNLQNWVIFRVVGKYSIYGASGYGINLLNRDQNYME